MPVAIACLLLLAVATIGGRWRACRLIALAGFAAVVVALLVDRPAGLDPGDAALAFVRTRSQDGDDGRVMRQQLVLAGLLRRLQDPAIVGDLPALLAATRGTIESDIPVSMQLRLLEMAPGLRADSVAFATITAYLTGGFLDNGMWVYQADWDVLPGIVQGFLDGE